ncbi:4Fe-4S dicluster domain-containing protein [Stackebrandtia nassauensis]|uniref:4Fe-4S ferredoxin, iron-sulfur binding protein n=1 Tax=Stackebrandtia nassauensis (strain DSM 44728 / CIP 108903 / NRRL B-16338 / NBRC 102104 / LLR-40K-21) TaxID=446470 RepID=D3PVM1_STANL|nr:4Fe-4S dicluster domain-containing protein [Stackebrandtia nassauensis]ADD43135.1 4Fe-4S ferredoxin, iron-sulfur binding protein [Stackebrandtia nassauensis DSM 44728]
MTTIPVNPGPVLLADLTELVATLRGDGYSVIAPTVRGDAVVLAEIDTAAQLPYGFGTEVEPGGYRVTPVDDRLAFTHVASPQSWKAYLHPSRERLWSADRDAEGFTITPDESVEPPRAFVGVRPCDLRAIGVLDRVLEGGERYRRRRDNVFIVAVNCTEPGSTCFCVSAGGGPRAESGFDLALTELPDGRLVAETGTPAGAELLRRLRTQAPAADTVDQADRLVESAATRMGRALPEGNLRDVLAATRESAHWDDVASRCLTCGNCTMACPTCFCTTVTDSTDLTGDHAERWQQWDSCFDIDFARIHGDEVRTSAPARYRQWISHKLGTWHDQFGESGCVGCGRCVAWCPVGIDITAEAAKLADEYTQEH